MTWELLVGGVLIALLAGVALAYVRSRTPGGG
jgi:hypothetical protein